MSVPEGKQGTPGQLGSSQESSSAATVTSLPVKKQTTPKWAQVKSTFLCFVIKGIKIQKQSTFL
jgi:hypothetical protein